MSPTRSQDATSDKSKRFAVGLPDETRHQVNDLKSWLESKVMETTGIRTELSQTQVIANCVATAHAHMREASSNGDGTA